MIIDAEHKNGFFQRERLRRRIQALRVKKTDARVLRYVNLRVTVTDLRIATKERDTSEGNSSLQSNIAIR